MTDRQKALEALDKLPRAISYQSQVTPHIEELLATIRAALATNASLKAAVEQVQIHQGHIQEELDAVIAERDAARERLREYDAKL